MELEEFLEIERKFREVGWLTREEVEGLLGYVFQVHRALENYVFEMERIFFISGRMCDYEGKSWKIRVPVKKEE